MRGAAKVTFIVKIVGRYAETVWEVFGSLLFVQPSLSILFAILRNFFALALDSHYITFFEILAGLVAVRHSNPGT